MQEIILIIHLVLAIALVAVILMQRSEGGAASLTGGGGGGGMGGFMSARGAANFLTRLTAGLAAAFIATSLLLAIFAGTDRSTDSLMQDLPAASSPDAIDEPVEPEAPAVPFSE